MRLELYNEVYKWLINQSVMRLDQKNHIIKNNGKTEIDEAQSLQFYNGLKVAEVINRIDPQKDYPSQLKEQNTPTARLFNWNVLTERLRRIGVDLDNDIKQLIVGGDLEMIGEVLKDIYLLQKQKGTLPDRQLSSALNQSKQIQWDQSKRDYNIDSLLSIKPLHQTEDLYEFILISICHNLNLKPKQAQHLLANNNKLLTHICVKGVKGLFNPVIQWLQEIYSNWGKFIQLCEVEEGNIQMLLNVVKPAIYSKEDEVVQWGLRVFTKLSFELANQDKLFHVYQWATKEGGGMQAIIQCQQRQPQLAEQLTQFVTQIARYDIQDLFTNQINKFFDDGKTKYEFLSGLLPFLVLSAKIKENFVDSGLIQEWIEQSLKISGSDGTVSRDHKMVGISFLTTVWSIYPQYMDLNLLTQNQILSLFQRAYRDNSYILRIFAIIQSFKLLDSLAIQQVNSAAKVYRKIIFILVENYTDYVIRELMFKQFKYLLTKHQNIPIDILIEPIVKNLQSQYNISDLEFFKVLTCHPNIKINSAILLLDQLVRIYNTNLVYSTAVLEPIQQLLQKFVESPDFQDFIIKMASVSLGVYQISTKNKRAVKNGQYQLDEESTLNAQKRALIIELIKYIINLRSYQVNQMLKPILVVQYLELKEFEKQSNKGIMVLLTMLGNPSNIIEEVISQNQQERQDISQSRQVSESQLFLDKRMQKLGSQDGNQGREQSFVHQNHLNIYLTQKDEDDVLMSQLTKENSHRPKNETQHRLNLHKSYLSENKISPYDQNVYWQSVYDEGELNLIDMPTIQHTNINLQNEEELQKGSLQMILKSYYKTLRYLFQKYTVNQIIASQKRLWQLDYSKQLIDTNDICRMFRDYEVLDFTTKKEIIQIINGVSNKEQEQINIQQLSQENNQSFSYGQSYLLDQSYVASSHNQSLLVDQSSKSIINILQDNTKMNLQMFGQFMIQFALLIYSRPPRDLRFLPAGQVFQELFKHFSQVARKRAENSLIFDDPEGSAIVADKQTIARWNVELAQHPELEVPESTVLNQISFHQFLKKVQEEDMIITFAMKKNIIIGLKESYIICYELLNDLLYSKLKLTIIEPYSQTKLVTKVQPLKAKGVHHDDYIDQLKQRQEKVSQSQLYISQKIQSDKINNMNLYRSIEVSLSPDPNFQVLSKSSQSQKLVNRSNQLKLVELQEKQINQDEKNQKWQKRKDYLDRQHLKIVDHKYYKEIDRVKMQQVEVEGKKKIPNEDSIVLPPLNKNLDKIRAYKSQMFQTYKLNEEEKQETIKNNQEQVDNKVKENKEFIKNYTKVEMDKIKQKVEVKHQKEEEKKNEEMIIQEKQKKFNEMNVHKKDHYNQVKSKKVEFNVTLKDLYNSDGVQNAFKKFARTGRTLFNHFTQYSDSLNQMSKRLDAKSWIEFSKVFQIFPNILNQSQVVYTYIWQVDKLFYNTLDSKNHIKEVNCQNELIHYEKDVSISYFEFEYILLRVAIKAVDYFNKIALEPDKATQLVSLQESKEIKEKPQDMVLQLAKIDQVTALTLVGLFNYLDIPEGTEALNSKLRLSYQNKMREPKNVNLPREYVNKLKDEDGYPEPPKDRSPKKTWNTPGTHKKLSKEEEDKVIEDEKNSQKFPFLKKVHDVEDIKTKITSEKSQIEKLNAESVKIKGGRKPIAVEDRQQQPQEDTI